MSNAAHAPLAQPVPDQDPELPTVQANASEDARARLFWQRLSARPYQFDLMHSLRYLQARHPGLPRLGQATRPKDEPLRLGQDPSLAFAPATIAEILPSRAGEPERMTVWNFGLYGPNGPLPTHITEYVRERLRQHDDATLARFSDIFHHRMLLLLFRAWSDAQPTASLDRPGEDPFGRYIDSFIGTGLPSQRARDDVPDHAKRFMAGELVLVERTNPRAVATVLNFERKVPVAARRFVASESFTKSNTKVKFGYIDERLLKLFGKTREDVPAGEIAVHTLLEDKHDPDILAAIKSHSARFVKPGHFYQLIEAQGWGRAGPLLLNGRGNIAYILDNNGAPWAVGANWRPYYGDWHVRLRAVADLRRWRAGDQVLSQVA